MHNGFTNSIRNFSEALRVLPGGVNSPVRAFKSVDSKPVFVERGEGSKIYDVDGNEYIDYVGSWGPLILGHCHSKVIEGLHAQLEKGTSYGAPTVIETQLAELIISALPSIEMIRMVNSGTEATMSALRLARAYTKRNKIVKFEGCYHGHNDSLLIKAGSGALTHGVPSSPGVTPNSAIDTITAPFNDFKFLENIFQQEGENIAAIIVEPIPGNMGVVLPLPGFLEGLRKLTRKYEALLIFDEVMTGFRVTWGGAQMLYNITPDITCLGKIIGGGLPVGAYGGRREIMEYISPSGPVYQAGTLSGNPLAMTAGLETLKILQDVKYYEELEKKSAFLIKNIAREAEIAGINIQTNRVGSMFCVFFAEDKVVDYNSACKSDTKRFTHFFKGMLNRGIYSAPSQFEASFISISHSYEDLNKTIEVSKSAFSDIKWKNSFMK